jgi:5-methyltetrahydrofolate--homocysteine methyltransferase
MVHVAREMKRQNFQVPLLIGGATTSRMHTAVKIAPEYDHGVVHVLDASRSVTVTSSLLNKEQKKDFLNTISVEYKKLKEDFGSRKSGKQWLSYLDAQSNKFKLDWKSFKPTIPGFTGAKIFADYALDEIAKYIDWQPFFIAWELHGKFPQILSDQKIGKEATKLYNDAKGLLQKIIKEKWLSARGVVGFWPAVATASDTVSVNAGSETFRLEFLRQQIKKANDQPNLSLADFVKPSSLGYNGQGADPETDFIGAFSVTIHGMESRIQEFMKDHDDYNKIILQALGDRLAEAFAELLHEKVRKELWGYDKKESLSNEELIAEKYSGIRPAPGYPACPDHTEKYKLFHLLGGEEATGINLTESLAMYPASSVCGWYFAHPESKYFGVGKIEKDQVNAYAERKNMPVEEIERWLRPSLEYDS